MMNNQSIDNFFFMVLRLILEKNKIKSTQKDMEHYPFNYYYRVKIKHNKIHIKKNHFLHYLKTNAK